ncbi:MAG: alkaline shock response membrane anchor protein AmaP [Oscillospiraceae bacterium]
MKFILRILLAALALVFVVGQLCIASQFLSVPVVSDAVRNLIASQSWFSIVLAIVSLTGALAFAVLFVAILAWPSHRKDFVAVQNMGRLEISKKSIESTAGLAVQDISDVKRFQVKVKGEPSPGKVKLEVLTETREPVDFVGLGNQIRSKVSQDLSGSLGITPGRINVKVVPFTPQEHASGHSRTAPPRVI